MSEMDDSSGIEDCLICDDAPPLPGQHVPWIKKGEALLEVVEEIGFEVSPHNRERTEFKKRGPGKTRKVKGGAPPPEYSLAETAADLRQALINKSEEEIPSLYWRLKKALNI